ncbi:LytTR family transcriptional regulator [Hymenobacter sp. CRA2]|uniref:LytTR family transcriptional regulator n=1 Tax=Hymenobacter sp. CRA2 TaxID=1955620 RepID=UPI0011162F95|nr:LytTR family transcriptional regulator [Hymenobacter sp. CRA2]
MAVADGGAQQPLAHRSFIVAAAHIKLLQAEHVILNDNTYIPIGSSYKPELLAYCKK